MRTLLLFLGTASAATVGGALFGQYALSWYPCELCIYQRIPHILILPIALVGAFFIRSDIHRRRAVYLCVVLLFITGTIALYHAGVEAEVFEGPSDCAAAAGAGQSLEELRAEIAGAALVSCKQAMAYVFGLSLAVWNALISFGLIIVIFIGLKHRGKTARLSVNKH